MMIQKLKDSDLKSTTKNAYVSVIKSIESYCKEKIENIYTDPETYWPKIESKCKQTSTCRNNIKILLTLMRLADIKKEDMELYNKWYKIFVTLTKEVNDENDNNVQTDKSLNWENVLKIRDEKLQDLSLLQQVVIGIYTYIPPRRQLDYWKMKIVYDGNSVPEVKKGTTGFIVLKDKKIIVHDYKTVKQFKEWEIAIPGKLLSIIEKYLNSYETRLEYLFCTSKGKPYSTLTSFTNSNNKIIKQIFKNDKVSVNSLRHAAATYVNHKKDMTRAEKKQWAEDMGHSFSMQQMYVEAIPSEKSR